MRHRLSKRTSTCGNHVSRAHLAFQLSRVLHHAITKHHRAMSPWAIS